MTTKTAAPKTAAKTAKTENAFADVEQVTQAARDHFEKVSANFAEQTEAFRVQSEEMLDIVRDNFAAAQERCQSMNTELADTARQEIAEAVDFVNDLGRAKTIADAMEIQRDYWTNLFETRVEQTKKMTETSVEAAREAFEPMNKQMAAFGSTASFEKMFPFANPFLAK